MKFSILVFGVLLVVLGISAYYLTGSTHKFSVENSHFLPGPHLLEVNPGSESITPENVSLVPGENNSLTITVTVLSGSGELSSLSLKLASQDDYQNCLGSQGNGCLASRDVSNDTLVVPLHASTIYYVILDNTASTVSKKVTLHLSNVTTTTQDTISKDSTLNWIGLILGLSGCLVAVYGLTRRTVIPWE